MPPPPAMNKITGDLRLPHGRDATFCHVAKPKQQCRPPIFVPLICNSCVVTGSRINSPNEGQAASFELVGLLGPAGPCWTLLDPAGTLLDWQLNLSASHHSTGYVPAADPLIQRRPSMAVDVQSAVIPIPDLSQRSKGPPSSFTVECQYLYGVFPRRPKLQGKARQHLAKFFPFLILVHGRRLLIKFRFASLVRSEAVIHVCICSCLINLCIWPIVVRVVTVGTYV